MGRVRANSAPKAGLAVNGFWLEPARNLDFAASPDATEERWDVRLGGEGGIRTLGTLFTHTRFPGVHLRPLGHLSGIHLRVSLNQRRHNLSRDTELV